MYHSDIYIDSLSFYDVVAESQANPSKREKFLRAFAWSRLILEDDGPEGTTAFILEEANKTFKFNGEVGDEIPENFFNLEEFGINLIKPATIKFGNSLDFYNSLGSPFSIFIKKEISKKEINNLESKHGFKHFTLDCFLEYYYAQNGIISDIENNSSLLQIPDIFSKERVMIMHSAYFLDNFLGQDKKSKNPMRDCFSKYIDSFFGNRDKEGFIEICLSSFCLSGIIEKTQKYLEDPIVREMVAGAKNISKFRKDVRQIICRMQLKEDYQGYKKQEDRFFDLFAEEALMLIVRNLKESLIKSGFKNFKITMIRTNIHSRFILTNNIHIAIDQFDYNNRRCDCVKNGIDGVRFNCFSDKFKYDIVELKKFYNKYKKLGNESLKFNEMCCQDGVKMKIGAETENPNYVYQLLNSTT
jgi:hypothetical protein